MTLEDCEIRGNHTGTAGGAGLVSEAGATLDGCRIASNTCDTKSAGVDAYFANLIVTGCLFTDNVSGNVSGGVRLEASSGTVNRCTFHGNSSPGPNGGTVTVYQSAGATIERCIFAKDQGGAGIAYLESVGPRSCNLFRENAAGPVVGDVTHVDDFPGDPLFCDADADDFHIADLSPAAPAGNLCGEPLGAYPVACGAVSIEEEPWGSVKTRWR